MTIKEQVIEYRNSHRESRVLLGVLLGEFERVEKLPNRTIKEITDSECIPIIKKLIASNIECQTPEENVILEQFLPTSLTPMEIINFINQHQFTNLGDCMKWFKINHTGLYDGKDVSQIYNNSTLWKN